MWSRGALLRTRTAASSFLIVRGDFGDFGDDDDEFEVEIYEDEDGSFYYIDPDTGE